MSSDAAKSDFFDTIDHPKMELIGAAESGSADLVTELLNSGVDVDSCNDNFDSVLQTAAACGHLKVVELLLDHGSNIESANLVGFTPLLHACRNGHAQVVDLLLQRGANANQTTAMGATALTLAIASNSGEIIKKIMALPQLDVNAAYHLAPTPLMTAIYRNSPKICGLLVRRGAKINTPHPGLNEIPPLALSIVLRGSSSLIYTLIELGADPSRKWMGLDAHHMAQKQQRMSLKEVLENSIPPQRHLKENVDVRKLILDNKCDALEKALTERAAEPSYPRDRSTPLMFAAIVGNLEAVKLLLVDSNCDRNAQDAHGMTALMYALVCGHNDVAKCLLNFNADVFQRTNDKLGAFTALDIAYFSRNFDLEILQLIHQRYVANRSKQSPLTSSTTSLDRTFAIGNFALGTKKNWINKVSGRLGLADSPSDAYEQAQNRKNDFLIEIGQSHVDWSQHDRFVLPVDLLQGDKKIEKVREMRTDEYTVAARRLALHCYSNGFLLKDFPIGVPSTSLDSASRQPSRLASSYGSYSNRLHSSGGARALDCSGSFASVAQQVAFDFDQHVKERRMLKFTNRKPSVNGPHSASLGGRPRRLGTNPTNLPKPLSSPMVVRTRLQCPNSPSTQSLKHFPADNSTNSFLHPARSESRNSLVPIPRLTLAVMPVSRSISASHLRTQSTPDPVNRISLENIWNRLDCADLGEYRAVFEREEFDADTLISSTESDLLNIGIHNEGHRQRILKIMRAFRSLS